MNISQLRPASQLAQRFGVKSILYGGPGTGKTPLTNTAPRPVLCAAEPGLLSMRGSSVPTFEAYTVPKLEEFWQWLFTSAEAKNYDTVAIDSVSQVAEIYLTKYLHENKDGRKAYGELSRKVMEIANALYYLPQKHIYLIAKQGTDDGGIKKRPWLPGQDLNVKIPHLYDEILHIGNVQIVGIPKPVLAIRTKDSFDVVARDRSGMLEEFEEPHIGRLFEKCMK